MKGEKVMFKTNNVNSQTIFKFFLKKFLVGCFCACHTLAMNAEAFNEISHKYVTKTSFEAITDLKSDDPPKKGLHEFSEFLKNDEQNYKELLVEYSVQPDIDENQGIYKYHFYNPITEANFMNEKKSALTKCKSHFSKAISFYNEGKKAEAYQQLGRSIHFMEDMNTPVHTAYDQPTDSLFKLPLHMDFEKVCDNVCAECKLEVVPEALNYYQDNSLDTIANSAATLSADNFYYLENNKIDKKTLAKNAISNAQKKILGIIYKFFLEISNK